MPKPAPPTTTTTRTTTTTTKPWSGRFAEATDADVERFTESISFDRRLWREDIAASTAHATMLASVGLITDAEAQALIAALAAIGRDIEAGAFAYRVELEDIHMHIEAALIERLGDVGRKLHTARSRNDQVQTDFRLWIREALDRVAGGLTELQAALVGTARRYEQLVMPAYTHWQRAQPVLAAHYLLAYVERLERDRDRLLDCRRRVNRLPLGSAALAGTSLPIDREQVARLLGFDGVTANSLDTSGDRDFAVESCFVLSLIAAHLAGWADEWIMFNTTEFGFLKLPDALCTGSSIMPQKKNPDVLELIRGKSAAVMAAVTQLQLLCHKLPLAYSRDLQEDKQVVFSTFDSVEAMLAMMAAMVRGMRFDTQAITARLGEGYMDATALMELLIKHGVPMRQAHEIVGAAVGECEARAGESATGNAMASATARAVPLATLTPADWRRLGAPSSLDATAVLGAERAVQALVSEGSSGPARVAAQLTAWETRLGVPRPE